MPNRNKQRGDRFERKCVQLLKDIGLESQRVPLSGGAGGEFSGDIKIKAPVLPRPLLAECKSRAGCGGYKQIVDWLRDNDLLFLNVARDEPLVVVPWRLFNVLSTALGRNDARGIDTGLGHGDRAGGREDTTAAEDRVSNRELIYEELCAAARPVGTVLPPAS